MARTERKAVGSPFYLPYQWGVGGSCTGFGGFEGFRSRFTRGRSMSNYMKDLDLQMRRVLGIPLEGNDKWHSHEEGVKRAGAMLANALRKKVDAKKKKHEKK